MILVLNPAETNWSANSDTSLKMHPSILHVTLTTPYRSTRAITSFSRFLAKHRGMPEGEIGSDVEGSKPIFFDIGDEEEKLDEALRHCHNRMGDNVTVLYTLYGDRDSMEKMKKLVKDWPNLLKKEPKRPSNVRPKRLPLKNAGEPWRPKGMY